MPADAPTLLISLMPLPLMFRHAASHFRHATSPLLLLLRCRFDDAITMPPAPLLRQPLMLIIDIIFIDY
jgi:hypothetical protein